MSLLEEKLRLLPARSGVYLFRDATGQILYVGKAKRLSTRVRSYFQAGRERDARLDRLIESITDLETIVTANEVEALILEANLIKQHRPQFNIVLKDDKRFPFLKLTTAHPFPGLHLTRKIVDDGSRYFGPYTHVKNLRQTLKRLRKVFPLRNCSDQRIARDDRECLEYFIERCPAPCTHRIESTRYREMVDRLIRFLEGDVAAVVRELQEEMRNHAAALRFEESARLRDDIATLERLALQQRMTPALPADTDVIALVVRGDRACSVALHVREGKILGTEQSLLLHVGGRREGEILHSYLTESYIDALQIPEVIVAAVRPQEGATIERWLTERAGRPVRLRLARGRLLTHLLSVARENAHLRLEEEELRAHRSRERVASAVYDLQERLQLSRTPYLIEGYDISNLHETYAVASKVAFRDGNPLKGAYRRFRIKQVQGPDDVAMIGEALSRRLRRLKESKESRPDLIVIDGGKGQVTRAWTVLREEGLEEIQVLGLAKREELVVIPGVKDPIRLPRNAEGLRLLQRIRNEAHRFAVSYHRKLRQGGAVRSQLDRLSGIGPKRRTLLLRRFGSLDRIRDAEPDQLTGIGGIGRELAERIIAELRKGGSA